MNDLYLFSTYNSKQEQKLKDKITSLVHLINATREIYNKNGVDKNFLETIIGAAIFYLPHTKVLWNGQVSLGALEALKTRNKVTKDHIYPRKSVARELLSSPKYDNITEDTLLKNYCEKYGVFCYVVSRENTALRKAAKDILDTNTSINPRTVYENASISVVDILNKDLLEIKRKTEIYEKYKGKTNILKIEI